MKQRRCCPSDHFLGTFSPSNAAVYFPWPFIELNAGLVESRNSCDSVLSPSLAQTARLICDAGRGSLLGLEMFLVLRMAAKRQATNVIASL